MLDTTNEIHALIVIKSNEKRGADLPAVHFWGISNFIHTFHTITTVNTEALRGLVDFWGSFF